ncbi:hypothetical protein B0H14DRAFT_3774068 [Mycena olivaceomarginata]|nr:hypothetical protein B0H14DRAFT_3774068 [Mycena olivaceomarginata]
MAGVILLEPAVPFDAAEWMGVGKLYKDVPIEVSDACCDARQIPADLQATFRDKWHSSVRWAQDKITGHGLEIFARVSWNTVHPGAPDGQLDWTRLVDDEWLSDGIIDTMMADIQSRALKVSTLASAGKSLFYFPLHVNGNHWIMFHVDFKHNVLGHGDSFGKKSAGSEFTPHLIRWLEASFHCTFKNLGDMLPHPSQGDFIHCGIYAANTLEHALFQTPLISYADCGSVRMAWFKIFASKGLLETYTAPLLANHNFPDLGPVLYLGEVLGIYRYGSVSGRHESFTDAETVDGLSYVAPERNINIFQHIAPPNRTSARSLALFTHAPMSEFVYLLTGVGVRALISLVSMKIPTMRTRKKKNTRSRKGPTGKKRKPKPPRGTVKKKKTDESKSGATQAPAKRQKGATGLPKPRKKPAPRAKKYQ